MKRFWDKVKTGEKTECWNWLACADAFGYGLFSIDGTMYRSHRVAWELEGNRKIPTGKIILHKCDNPSCVNPEHLQLGTYADNNKDMADKGRAWWANYDVAPKARLTKDEVYQIREKYESGGYTHAELGDEYGVARTTISNITNLATWNKF